MLERIETNKNAGPHQIYMLESSPGRTRLRKILLAA